MTKDAGYSHKQDKIDAIKVKIRRARTMAIAGSNPDFKLSHPDWVRDAQSKNFTQLEKIVKEQCDKYAQRAQQRRDKRAGKT